MVIRPIKKEDLSVALELIKAFQEETMDNYGLLCDDEVAAKVMHEYMDNTLVLEIDGEVVGALAGLITSYPLNGDSIFQEIFWYIKPEHRKKGGGIKMLIELERRCKECGIKKIVMAHTGICKADELKKIYTRFKYTYLETHYIKSL